MYVCVNVRTCVRVCVSIHARVCACVYMNMHVGKYEYIALGKKVCSVIE